MLIDWAAQPPMSIPPVPTRSRPTPFTRRTGTLRKTDGGRRSGNGVSAMVVGESAKELVNVNFASNPHSWTLFIIISVI